jgi:hypothetical protein
MKSFQLADGLNPPPANLIFITRSSLTRTYVHQVTSNASPGYMIFSSIKHYVIRLGFVLKEVDIRLQAVGQ